MRDPRGQTEVLDRRIVALERIGRLARLAGNAVGACFAIGPDVVENETGQPVPLLLAA